MIARTVHTPDLTSLIRATTDYRARVGNGHHRPATRGEMSGLWLESGGGWRGGVVMEFYIRTK